MRRKLVQLGMFAALAAILPMGVTAAEEKKAPTTKEIMKACFGEKGGFCGKCAAAGKSMNWEEAAKVSKSLADCAANLPKNKEMKGDHEAWEKLAKKFAEQAAAVNAAVAKKDAEAYNAAVAAFADKANCMACHSAHRVKAK